ncbi:unnamed protein product [Zymoseptoria tritici ST99CH_1A5]|uniref:Uncharacterized protein n=1 Tax=Zymoseptoria tritici ST99CH_1A5 TaxID=1276529 RepID=A0A1Y6M1I8_ZYMTR|nr:unnamed protein product [Zymoseptoria tritici ST99CH_1A5]
MLLALFIALPYFGIFITYDPLAVFHSEQRLQLALLDIIFTLSICFFYTLSLPTISFSSLGRSLAAFDFFLAVFIWAMLINRLLIHEFHSSGSTVIIANIASTLAASLVAKIAGYVFGY